MPPDIRAEGNSVVANKNRRVVFARINRRRPQQETLDLRPFGEDLSRLGASHAMSHVQRKTQTHPQRQWFAADMTITPSEDFMVGTLGYAEQQTHVQFDEDAWSWVKGETRSDDAGSEQTVVPFAIDLREHERWVAFAPTGRMRPRQFVVGFQKVLNEAVLRAGLIPADWEVDLVTSEGRIEAWLSDHPRVYFVRRTIKFSNPGKDLSVDEAEMRALGANRKTEEFAAPRGQTLRTEGDDFREKLDGTGRGNLDVILRRGGPMGTASKCSTAACRPTRRWSTTSDGTWSAAWIRS